MDGPTTAKVTAPTVVAQAAAAAVKVTAPVVKAPPPPPPKAPPPPPPPVVVKKPDPPKAPPPPPPKPPPPPPVVVKKPDPPKAPPPPPPKAPPPPPVVVKKPDPPKAPPPPPPKVPADTAAKVAAAKARDSSDLQQHAATKAATPAPAVNVVKVGGQTFAIPVGKGPTQQQINAGIKSGMSPKQVDAYLTQRQAAKWAPLKPIPPAQRPPSVEPLNHPVRPMTPAEANKAMLAADSAYIGGKMKQANYKPTVSGGVLAKALAPLQRPARQMANSLAATPQGVKTIGVGVGKDLAAAAHGDLRFKNTRAIGKGMASSVAQDVRHPLRRSGYLTMDVVAVASVGAGAAGKFGTAGRLGEAGGLEDGFKVTDWSGYPKGGPRPTGTLRLREGPEYDDARLAANKANRKLHRQDPSLKGKQIHEIQTVKFGGSPTDPANKIPLTPEDHMKYTKFWYKAQLEAEGKLPRTTIAPVSGARNPAPAAAAAAGAAAGKAAAPNATATARAQASGAQDAKFAAVKARQDVAPIKPAQKPQAAAIATSKANDAQQAKIAEVKAKSDVAVIAKK
jgi:hypothetical protein